MSSEKKKKKEVLLYILYIHPCYRVSYIDTGQS